jgi:hypothetical protein
LKCPPLKKQNLLRPFPVNDDDRETIAAPITNLQAVWHSVFLNR